METKTHAPNETGEMYNTRPKTNGDAEFKKMVIRMLKEVVRFTSA